MRRGTLIVVLLCLAGVGRSCTQDTATPAKDAPQIAITTLATPNYPPLARQARIAGDVTLAVRIQPDGSVKGIDLVSGHPILAQAALESARHSEFSCAGCTKEETRYSMMYTFVLADLTCCHDANTPDTLQPTVVQTSNRVTVTIGHTCICDPIVSRTKIRAAKCLYLWKCGQIEMQ